MLERIMELERELNLNGGALRNEYLRKYVCEPSSLEDVLTEIYPEYFEIIPFDMIDCINIYIKKNFDVELTTWNGDEQINELVRLPIENDIEAIEKIMRNIQEA